MKHAYPNNYPITCDAMPRGSTLGSMSGDWVWTPAPLATDSNVELVDDSAVDMYTALPGLARLRRR